MEDFSEAIRLNPNYTLAYNCRGWIWIVRKKYDQAIRDYSQAIRIDPRDPYGFYGRGTAWSRKQNYDEAIRDFDAAIRLNPKCGAQFHRSIVQMLSRRPEAAEGFLAILKVQGGTSRAAAYTIIFGHFAARQIGDEPAAKRFLEEWTDKLSESWPRPAIKYLRGEIDETALLEKADDDRKRTDAHCCLGLDQTLKGHKEQALAHYRWVQDHGDQTLWEYLVAQAELERMEKSKEE
jgi:tetratricopeptide (TPR) repeat protein